MLAIVLLFYTRPVRYYSLEVSHSPSFRSLSNPDTGQRVGRTYFKNLLLMVEETEQNDLPKIVYLIYS